MVKHGVVGPHVRPPPVVGGAQRAELLVVAKVPHDAAGRELHDAEVVPHDVVVEQVGDRGAAGLVCDTRGLGLCLCCGLGCALWSRARVFRKMKGGKLEAADC